MQILLDKANVPQDKEVVLSVSNKGLRIESNRIFMININNPGESL